MRLAPAIIAILLCSPITASSDDLLSCVHPDVRTAFLSSGSPSVDAISGELLQDFAVVRYPDDFLLIGSSSSERFSRAAFLTDRKPADAESALKAIFGESGWRSLPQRNRYGASWGFQQIKTASPQYVSLCHADGESIVMSSRIEDRGTFVWLTKYTGNGKVNCNEQAQTSPRVGHEITDELMPLLELPADVQTRGSGYGGAIRGSGDDAEAHVRVSTGMQPGELLEHFSSQLMLQGWILDTTWTGAASEGSAWSLSRDNLPRTVGTLYLVTHSTGDYTVRFSVLAI